VRQLSKQEIKEIAEQLDCGFRCFIHKINSELIFIPDTTKHLDMDTEAWETEMNELDSNFGDYFEVELYVGSPFLVQVKSRIFYHCISSSPIQQLHQLPVDAIAFSMALNALIFP
jgi:hypothetical protein